MARERHVAHFVGEVFRRGGLVRGVRRAEAVLLWPQVVGPDVARFSAAVGLQNGTLVVDVPDPETALHLGMQRHHVLAAYAERLGKGAVRELRFRVGRSPEPPEAPPERAHVDVDPEAVAALARALQGLDDDVAGPAMRAGKALLTLRARRLAAGWRPCPVCSTLCETADDPRALPPGAPAGIAALGPTIDVRRWCSTCRRHAGTPKVQRLALRLCLHPDDACAILTDDERAVAARLALARLRAVSLELLPQALGDPGLRPQLAQLAHAAAALHHGLPLADVVADHLVGAVDERVIRALGPGGARPSRGGHDP
jgi:hypothetical protein